MKIKSILKHSTIVAFIFSQLVMVNLSLAEDPWNSYQGWSGVEGCEAVQSWYLWITAEGGSSSGIVFSKWYKKEYSTGTVVRPNRWRIDSSRLSGKGTVLWVERVEYYYQPPVFVLPGMWTWRTYYPQTEVKIVLADSNTLLKTVYPSNGQWFGKNTEHIEIGGVGYLDSNDVTGFKIVDEETGLEYGVGEREKYNDYVNNGIEVTKVISEGKHTIRPEVTVKTSFSDWTRDRVYRDFYLTFVNNKAVTFYLDRHDPVATITSIKNSDGTPGFPGPEDSNITYTKSSNPIICYSLSDNFASLGSFEKADAYLEWNDQNGNPQKMGKMNFGSSWGEGSLSWANLSDCGIPGGKRYTVSIIAFDKAENVSSEVETFYIDTHLPKCSIDTVEVKEGAYLYMEGSGEPGSVYAIYVQDSKGKDVLLTDPDDWSTYESMSSSRYRVNGAGQWEFAIAIDRVRNFVQEGNLLKIKINSRDYAQNEYVSNYYEFTVDIRRPSLIWEVSAGEKMSGIISETSPPGELFYFNKDILTVKATAQDESGIEKICYLSDLFPDDPQTVFNDPSFPKEVSKTFDVGIFDEDREPHWLRVYAIDRAGWTSVIHTFNFIVDKTPPQKPVLTSSPYINGDTVALTGKGEAGCDVEVYESGSLLGSTSVYGDGNWSLEIDNITLGDHSLTLKSKDKAGNSTINDSLIQITIAVRRPSPPVISEPRQGQIITDTYIPTFKGITVPEGIVELYDNGVLLGQTQADKEGKFSFTPPKAMKNGYHSLSCRVYKDEAISEMSEAVEWQLSVSEYIGKQDLLLVAPDEVMEDSDFAVTICDKDTGKPVSGARVVFLGKEYTTDDKGKAGARGSAFRRGIVASALDKITEEMQGPASFRHNEKDLKGEVKMATLFAEKEGKSADKDIAIRKGGDHKFGTFNRDGTNDRVYFSQPEDYPIRIYDRSGRKVRTLSESEGSWDGLDDNGNRVKMGVYIYQTQTGKTGTILVRR
jgi:hypothetical protein